jgi:hypothetical protein
MKNKFTLIAIIIAVVLAVTALVLWWILPQSNNDISDNKTSDTSAEEPDKESSQSDSIMDELNNKLTGIDADSNLTKQQNRAKTIEAMEQARKQYEDGGNVDKANAMRANIEVLNSLPLEDSSGNQDVQPEPISQKKEAE